MIPDAQVEEVRARADIVDVIGEFVPLKKAGKEFKARCPFHDERTPSFYVVPDKGFYKCFGCGESGDVFGFLMRRSGMDFVDAVKHVAERAGVEIREVTGRSEDDPNAPLYELNAFAVDFYRRQLLDPEVGRQPRDYLAARGVDEETAERFELGYAPDDWREFRDAALHHGFDEELILTAGLVSTSEKAKDPYDRFRNRIVFPIQDVSGRAVAFGARVLGSGEGGPKYLNSPETPVYHKGSVLYGLSWAKNAIRREGHVLVVEGYMDVVMLASAGLSHVVAPLGTAVTEEQARLLSRYGTRVLLLFDSDRAGLEATFRAGDVLLAAGMHPGVVTLPRGEDPDTLVRKEGSAGLEHYLDQAVDIMDRKLSILEEHDFFSSIERTRRALDKLLPTVRAVADPALRDIYLDRVARKTGVRPETLEAELARRPARRRTRSSPRTEPAPRPRQRGAERKVVLLMTRGADFVERAAEQLGPGDFEDPAFRAIFEALLEDHELRAPPAGMDPVAAKRFEQLLEDPEDFQHSGRVFDESVVRVKLDRMAREAEELETRMRQTADEDEKRAMIEELKALGERRRELGQDWSSAHVVRRGRSRPDA